MTAGDEVEPGPAVEPFRVRVVRSRRRHRTTTARLVDGTLTIRLPATLTEVEEQEWIARWTARFARRRDATAIDLDARAERLARELGLPRASSITWSERMTHRWGSCTPDEGSVRVSHALASYPRWVLDYVIVHELAHLDVPDHSPAFWSLVSRYPLSERARGFLIAKAGGEVE